jgi:hypothetical protein
MAACYHSIYCDLIHNGDATTQDPNESCVFLPKYVFFHGSTAQTGLDLLIDDVSGSYSDTPHFVGLLWTGRRDHCTTQQNLIHVPGGIRNSNPSKRGAADSRLRSASSTYYPHCIYDPRLIASNSHPKSEHLPSCYY